MTEDEYKPYKESFRILGDDVKRAKADLERVSEEHQIDTDEVQYSARTVIRTFFAYVEGSLWAYKFALLRHMESPALKDIVMLREKRFEIDDKGEAREKDYFPPLKNNIRFVLDTIHRTLVANRPPITLVRDGSL